jgi:hypothetical protein
MLQMHPASTTNRPFARDEQFLTTDEYQQRFKKSKASQCRDRAAGQGPPFILDGNKILYPLTLALEFHAKKLVSSTAEISSQLRGNRYKHLQEARNKALIQRVTGRSAPA